ncbi:GABA permease [Trichophyton rubrum]|uniref:GABA permease n=1 Tax=Trichophyton rubrum TaxID=5551 RepID=A0A178F5U2_TRIRU|nr:GABA permease [Trichophyton rubrum]
MTKAPAEDGARIRRASEDANANAALAKMGYKSELPRNLGMMSVLGLSFAIMAAPFGLSTTLYITLTDGQSVTIIWGWVIVTLISTAIAASLSEICSVYPTAGGVYYWSAMLSTREWAPLMSFIDGWLTLVGNWTVTLSINFSGGQLILSAISLWKEDFVPNQWQTILMFWAVMLVPTGWAFFVGLLQPAYTLTGYGMVAAMCEETQNPHREVPKAIVLSVVAAGITGLVYLITLLFVLPEVKMLLSVANGQPIGLLFKTVTGSAAGGFGMLFLIMGIQIFAGIGALTAASRCTYAFARDGAIPGSRVWKQVSSRFGVPLWGIILSTLVDCLLGLIYFGSAAAFNSFTGVATICLSTSMNYASVVFAGFASISVVWYFVRARKAFTGPPMSMDDARKDEAGVFSGKMAPHMEDGAAPLDLSKPAEVHVEHQAKFNR